MPPQPLNPFRAFWNTLGLALRGRVHFPRRRLGETLVLENGEPWVIFRQVIVDPGPGRPPKPGAVFRPRFHVAGMSVRQNTLFSWLPVPFILGLPGFRSKLWLYNPANGDFQGIYEWDTVQDAENYGRSFAMQFMARRSVPGSVSYSVTAIAIG